MSKTRARVQKIPGDVVLTYGTLREGAHNDHLWRGLAVAEPGFIRGYKLYSVNRGYFPILLPGRQEDRVRVDVIVWDGPHTARIGMRRFDTLEGFPMLYDRVRWTAYLPEIHSEVDGWLYLPNDPGLLDSLTLVESGDWFDHQAPV